LQHFCFLRLQTIASFANSDLRTRPHRKKTLFFSGKPKITEFLLNFFFVQKCLFFQSRILKKRKQMSKTTHYKQNQRMFSFYSTLYSVHIRSKDVDERTAVIEPGTGLKWPRITGLQASIILALRSWQQPGIMASQEICLMMHIMHTGGFTIRDSWQFISSLSLSVSFYRQPHRAENN
jgi:hypothetical protein